MIDIKFFEETAELTVQDNIQGSHFMRISSRQTLLYPIFTRYINYERDSLILHKIEYKHVNSTKRDDNSIVVVFESDILSRQIAFENMTFLQRLFP